MELKQINILGYPVQVSVEHADEISCKIERLVRLEHSHLELLDRYDTLSEHMRKMDRSMSTIQAAHQFLEHVIEDSFTRVTKATD